MPTQVDPRSPGGSRVEVVSSPAKLVGGSHPVSEKASAPDAWLGSRDDGFVQVQHKRRPRGNDLPPAPPAKLAPVAPWKDGGLYRQSDEGLPRRFHWTEDNLTGHANAHTLPSVALGKAIMAKPVGSAQPTFVDRVSGEIYRFDRSKKHMVVATADGAIKTCFCPKENGKPGDGEKYFRELALINAVNSTGKSLSELGNEKVHNPQSSHGFISQRQAILRSFATRGRIY